MTIKFILPLILVLLLVFIFVASRDTFVPLNVFNDELEKIDEKNPLEKLSYNVNIILNSNVIKPPPQNYKTTFLSYGNIKFELEDVVKSRLNAHLQTLFAGYSDTVINANITDIYYNQITKDSTDFIFNTVFSMSDGGSSYRINVYISILDYSSYFLDSGDVNPYYRNDSNIVINSVILQENLSNVLEFAPFDTNENMTRIKTQMGVITGIPFSLSVSATPAPTPAVQKKILNRKSGCFDDTGKEITGNITETECFSKGGQWDSVPENPTLCPFYKANRNYPNNFGELVYSNNDSTCEMPLNTQKIGYRYYSADPENKPLCYNCKSDKIGVGSLGMCCDKQMDTIKYPELLSPDYAFENDSYIRNKYSDIFQQMGLLKN